MNTKTKTVWSMIKKIGRENNSTLLKYFNLINKPITDRKNVQQMPWWTSLQRVPPKKGKPEFLSYHRGEKKNFLSIKQKKTGSYD